MNLQEKAKKLIEKEGKTRGETMIFFHKLY